jgi:Ras GTPase-activating-like protein IQGAP2/3
MRKAVVSHLFPERQDEERQPRQIDFRPPPITTTSAMDRANSVPSNGQRPVLNPATFAYQTRLLERTSSQRSTTSTLSRSSSASSRAFQSPTSTGSSGTHTATRRWTPSHRSGTSLDLVRGRLEERAKTDAILEGISNPSDATNDIVDSPPKAPVYDDGSETSKSKDQLPFRSTYEDQPSTFTPPSSKRQTLPATIITSPLSPNTTGVSVVSPDPPSSGLSTGTVNRIRLPNSNPSPASIVEKLNNVAASSEPTPTIRQVSRIQRSNTLESTFQNARHTFSKLSEPTSSAPPSYPPTYSPTKSAPLRTRPSSISGFSSIVGNGTPSPLEDQRSRPLRSYTRSARSVSPEKPPTDSTPPSSSIRLTPQPPSNPPPEPPVSSAMSPRVYRSSYMANKKGNYGEALTTGRRFGRHLPRIASGDRNEDWVADEPEKPLPLVPERPLPSQVKETFLPPSSPERPSPSKVWGSRLPPSSPERPSFDKRSSTSTLDAFSYLDEEQKRHQTRERKRQGIWGGPGALPAVPTSPTKQDIIIPSAVLNPTPDVAGIPGRLKLSRKTPAAAAATPLPSSRLTRGLWADTQRHLIQAYEYLCHVGEAQQWVEGCLDQELGFGVVEMEEELRNGIVLAKLVRKFKGEAGARRIYEVRPHLSPLSCLLSACSQARKLDFRHSDNINYFFDFVRHDVGLPEVTSLLVTRIPSLTISSASSSN